MALLKMRQIIILEVWPPKHNNRRRVLVYVHTHHLRGRIETHSVKASWWELSNTLVFTLGLEHGVISLMLWLQWYRYVRVCLHMPALTFTLHAVSSFSLWFSVDLLATNKLLCVTAVWWLYEKKTRPGWRCVSISCVMNVYLLLLYTFTCFHFSPLLQFD